MYTKNKHDLAGKQIGCWRVTDECIKVNGYRKWKCQCSCGTVRMVNEYNLLSGKSKSCGCCLAQRFKEQREDLTGKTFGRLTVINRAEDNIRGQERWNCICQCGTKCIIKGHDLRNEKRKSCGCMRKESKNIVDLKGMIFEMLTVQYDTGKRSYKGSVLWHCKCECGKEIDVAADALINGKYVSCGCKRKKRQKKIHETLHHVDHTCIEYLEKRNSRRDNTSGYQGVQRLKSGRYRASIGFKGKRYHLGYYGTLEEAVSARQEAEEKTHKAYVLKYYEWKKRADRDAEWAKANPLVFESPF